MYRLSDDVLLHKEDDKQFLVNTTTGKVYLLNDIAILIVDGLYAETDVAEIKRNIQAQFPDIPSEQINTDIDNYITLLLETKSLLLIE